MNECGLIKEREGFKYLFVQERRGEKGRKEDRTEEYFSSKTLRGEIVHTRVRSTSLIYTYTLSRT